MARKSAGSDIADAEKLRSHLRIIVDVGLLASQSLSLDAFLDHVVSQVALALEVSNTKIMRYRPAEGDLLLTNGVGWREGVVGKVTFGIDLASPPGRALQTGEAVAIDDITGSTEYVASPLLRSHGIISVANVPIMIDNAVWGVLEVDSNERRDFREDTLEFVLAISRIVAGVIQRHEAQNQHSRALELVAREVQQRNLSLSEMQHRVKNYFQLILSMVTAQGRKAPYEEGRQLISQIAERITAVALANDQLRPDRRNHAISMPAYLQALCSGIVRQQEKVILSVNVDEIMLPSERAVPVGLIVNELVTNSLKYAFAGRDGGSIAVELSAAIGNGQAVLTVWDNGTGYDPAKADGSGLKLVQGLARQIAGQVEHRTSAEGTSTRITFIDGSW